MSARELRQERHAISILMNKELEKGTPAAMREWKALDEKQEALRVRIDAEERTSELNSYMNTVRNAELPNVGNEMGYDNEARSSAIPFAAQRSTESYKRDFDAFVRKGVASPELRALGDSVGNDGASLVPAGFQYEIDEQLKSYAGIRQACRVITTPTGNPLPWPTATDVNNTGEFLGEFAATGTADPTFGNVTLGATILSSKYVKVSVALLQDSAFPISSVLAEMFAKRIARASEPAYLTGNGTNAPNGLLTAIQAASVPFTLATGANANSGNSADTDLNSIGTTDIDELLQGLDPAYQQNAAFMAHSSTWAKIRRTLDKYGRPIWQTSIASGAPDSVWGKKYYINQQMAAIGAGAVSMICGDFNHYVIRDSCGLTLVRYNELFMQNYEVGFQAFVRTDGQLLQSAAFTYLQHPDS
jgi:HK97 family phage major capsid protein